MLASLVTAVILLTIQQNEEHLVHALSRPVLNVRVESAQRFVTEAELTNLISRYLGTSFSPLMSWEQNRALKNILGSGVPSQRKCGPTRWSWRFRKRLRLPDGVRQLLNQFGEIFEPPGRRRTAGLPLLVGSEGEQYRVMEQYRAVSPATFSGGAESNLHESESTWELEPDS